MILDAVRGRGGPRIGKATGGGGPRSEMPMAPPPFIGTWASGKGVGRGGKKKRPKK